jgi:hypothetical protein
MKKNKNTLVVIIAKKKKYSIAKVEIIYNLNELYVF